MNKIIALLLISSITVISASIVYKTVFADTPQTNNCEDVINRYTQRGFTVCTRRDTTDPLILLSAGICGVATRWPNTYQVLISKTKQYAFIIKDDCSVRGVDLSN